MLQLTFVGFLVSDPAYGGAYFADHQTKLSQWIADGTVTSKLHVTEGIDNAAEGLVGIFKGQNFGKAVLKIKS